MSWYNVVLQAEQITPASLSITSGMRSLPAEKICISCVPSVQRYWIFTKHLTLLLPTEEQKVLVFHVRACLGTNISPNVTRRFNTSHSAFLTRRGNVRTSLVGILSADSWQWQTEIMCLITPEGFLLSSFFLPRSAITAAGLSQS